LRFHINIKKQQIKIEREEGMDKVSEGVSIASASLQG
jgi:hypothetical protein